MRVTPLSKEKNTLKPEAKYPISLYNNVRLRTLTSTVPNDPVKIPFKVRKELEMQRALFKLRSKNLL